MNILRNLGNDMAAIFGRHPDAAQLEYRSDPAEDTAGDGLSECETCEELFPECDKQECEVCLADGFAAYAREHDSGVER